MNKNSKKVYVGMSGGVDSSLSAALLKEKGYDVTGVFIKVWQPHFIECTWRDDRRDAMRVASELDISFVTLDLEKEYKKEVIDYMMREYEAGHTPNPDVMCNRFVKFGAFWKWAKGQGADYIATGHYAQSLPLSHDVYFFVDPYGKTHHTSVCGSSSHSFTPRTRHDLTGEITTYGLFTSKDMSKDQTYFLWTLTSNDLAHVLFPIGHMTKNEVRAEAEKRRLYTHAKKDSQGLCFIGTIDMKEFLIDTLGKRKGDVLNEKGEIIGTHDGTLFYTIGERHGFTITKRHGDITAYYVVKKDLKINTITVSHVPPDTSIGNEVPLREVSFVAETPSENTFYEARARYRAPLTKVCMVKNHTSWSVVPQEEGLVAVSGQSLVLYKEGACLGGGIIV